MECSLQAAKIGFSVNKIPQLRKTYIFFENIPEFANLEVDKAGKKGYNCGVGRKFTEIKGIVRRMKDEIHWNGQKG